MSTMWIFLKLVGMAILCVVAVIVLVIMIALLVAVIKSVTTGEVRKGGK